MIHFMSSQVYWNKTDRKSYPSYK